MFSSSEGVEELPRRRLLALSSLLICCFRFETVLLDGVDNCKRDLLVVVDWFVPCLVREEETIFAQKIRGDVIKNNDSVTNEKDQSGFLAEVLWKVVEERWRGSRRGRCVAVVSGARELKKESSSSVRRMMNLSQIGIFKLVECRTGERDRLIFRRRTSTTLGIQERILVSNHLDCHNRWSTIELDSINERVLRSALYQCGSH